MSEISDDEKKELYKAVVRQSKKGLDYKELANRYNVKEHVLSHVATSIRKKGVELPKRSRSSLLTTEFVEELKVLFNSI